MACKMSLLTNCKRVRRTEWYRGGKGEREAVELAGGVGTTDRFAEG